MTETAAEQLHYTAYSVYQRLGDGVEGPAHNADELLADLNRVEGEFEKLGVRLLGYYDASGFRAEADIMVWLTASNPTSLQSALRLLERSLAGGQLLKTWQAVGVHRTHEFSREHKPAFIEQDKFKRKEWITVYPFVRSYDWYLLSEEERREMLIEHGKYGREYPNVWANTTAAFALGDYEWLLSFESDNLYELVDMMRHLRYTNARKHVRDELPFHVGRLLGGAKELAQLLGN